MVCCRFRDLSFANPAWINFVSRCELAFEFANDLLHRWCLHCGLIVASTTTTGTPKPTIFSVSCAHPWIVANIQASILSPILIDRAEQLYSFENRSFLVGSIYDLPFSNGSFDAAFSVNLWHLLADLDMASNETRLRRPRPKWPRLRRRSRSLPRRRTQNRPTRGKLPA